MPFRIVGFADVLYVILQLHLNLLKLAIICIVQAVVECHVHINGASPPSMQRWHLWTLWAHKFLPCYALIENGTEKPSFTEVWLNDDVDTHNNHTARGCVLWLLMTGDEQGSKRSQIPKVKACWRELVLLSPIRRKDSILCAGCNMEQSASVTMQRSDWCIKATINILTWWHELYSNLRWP